MKKAKIPKDPGPKKYQKDADIIMKEYADYIEESMFLIDEKRDEIMEEENVFNDINYGRKHLENLKSKFFHLSNLIRN